MFVSRLEVEIDNIVQRLESYTKSGKEKSAERSCSTYQYWNA